MKGAFLEPYTALVLELSEDGFTAQEIADVLKARYGFTISSTTVNTFLRRHGVGKGSGRNQEGRHKKLTQRDAERLDFLYNRMQMSLDDMSRVLHTPSTTLIYRMQRLGIKRRTNLEGILLASRKGKLRKDLKSYERDRAPNGTFKKGRLD